MRKDFITLNPLSKEAADILGGNRFCEPCCVLPHASQINWLFWNRNCLIVKYQHCWHTKAIIFLCLSYPVTVYRDFRKYLLGTRTANILQESCKDTIKLFKKEEVFILIYYVTLNCSNSINSSTKNALNSGEALLKTGDKHLLLLLKWIKRKRKRLGKCWKLSKTNSAFALSLYFDKCDVFYKFTGWTLMITFFGEGRGSCRYYIANYNFFHTSWN